MILVKKCVITTSFSEEKQKTSSDAAEDKAF